MKTMLAVLLSFILMEAPVLALQGGYSLPNSSNGLTGTYAGVLIPSSDDVLASNAVDIGTNSLGLFTLGVPTTGLGAGTVSIFSVGRTFTGTIQALADPE